MLCTRTSGGCVQLIKCPYRCLSGRGKKKLHFTPQDLMSFFLLPTAPTAAEICHRAKALPSVRSNSFAVGRIWHGHKGPLFVPEVGHTMQSFPLVTQELGFHSQVRNTLWWLQPTNLNTIPMPNPRFLFPCQVLLDRGDRREQLMLLGALIPANSKQSCSKDGSDGLLELWPQSLCRIFAIWIWQDLNIRLFNFQVYSCP